MSFVCVLETMVSALDRLLKSVFWGLQDIIVWWFNGVQAAKQVFVSRIYGVFLKWGYPNGWLVYFMEKTIYKWIA